MAQRNNELDKIGLRGSHFTLGNFQQPFKTTNQSTLNNQPVQRQMPSIKDSNVKSAVEHDKANLRASHFNLGTSDPKGFYYTTNSLTLKHHENPDRAVLSEAQKKDLRNHHFKMGQYAPTTKTVNNLNFNEKPIVQMKDHEKLKSFMTGHHHNFREMPNTLMSTKYNDDYNNQLDTEALHQGIPQEKIREKALALRNSNILLGKEQPRFQSVQQKDYTKKDNVYVPQTKDLQSSHFDLGIQRDPMCTTNDLFHNQQPIIRNPLAEETMNDLRSSHFKLGQDNVSYQTEFGGNFQKKSEIRQKQSQSTAALQQNHFSLGADGKQTYQTAYSTFMQKPDNAKDQQGQARDQTQDRGSNFIIGKQGNSYTSEFNANFSKQEGRPAQLNESKKADLRSSHFQFNDIPQNTYQTYYKSCYQSKDQGRGVLDENRKQDLRKNHFNFGNQGDFYQTTQQRSHKHPGIVQPSALSERQKQDLRTHHFKLG